MIDIKSFPVIGTFLFLCFSLSMIVAFTVLSWKVLGYYALIVTVIISVFTVFLMITLYKDAKKVFNEKEEVE